MFFLALHRKTRAKLCAGESLPLMMEGYSSKLMWGTWKQSAWSSSNYRKRNPCSVPVLDKYQPELCFHWSLLVNWKSWLQNWHLTLTMRNLWYWPRKNLSTNSKKAQLTLQQVPGKKRSKDWDKGLTSKLVRASTPVLRSSYSTACAHQETWSVFKIASTLLCLSHIWQLFLSFLFFYHLSPGRILIYTLW